MPSPGLVARVSRARRSLERLRRLARIPREEYLLDEDARALPRGTSTYSWMRSSSWRWRSPGMRNILVLGYAEVDHEIVYDVLTGELEGLARLLRALWLAAEGLDP